MTRRPLRATGETMKDYYIITPSSKKFYRVLKTLDSHGAVIEVIIIARVDPRLLGGLRNIDPDIRWKKAWLLAML